jgi:hypothetical protein
MESVLGLRRNVWLASVAICTRNKEFIRTANHCRIGILILSDRARPEGD